MLLFLMIFVSAFTWFMPSLAPLFTNVSPSITTLLNLLPLPTVMLFAYFFIILTLSNFNLISYLKLLWVLYSISIVYESTLLYLMYFNGIGSVITSPDVCVRVMNWSLDALSCSLDNLSLVFSIIVHTIGLFANAYTIIYLGSDNNSFFFINFLNVFILSMLLLVKTNNLFTLILSWEFLGISSFFLIGHYTSNPYSLNSAFKAFAFNSVSDVSLFIFAVLYIYDSNTFSILPSSTQPSSLAFYYLPLLLLSSFIKSAQFVFFFWLPDSMEAPIPASSLIHSATLVSAGIYLCSSFYPQISSYPLLLDSLVFIGLVSATVFSFVSALQTDINKLLAYSTIANCGFMYFLIGSGLLDESLAYFVSHGLLNSSLFMFFGYYILLNGHSQDFQFWSVSKKESLTLALISVSLLSLGALNLTLSFDINHSVSAASLRCGTFSNGPLLINYLFYLYSVNSVFYSTSFILSLPSFPISNKTNFSGFESLYSLIAAFTLLSYGVIYLVHNYSYSGCMLSHSFNYAPLTTQSIPAAISLIFLSSSNFNTVGSLFLPLVAVQCMV